LTDEILPGSAGAILARPATIAHKSTFRAFPIKALNVPCATASMQSPPPAARRLQRCRGADVTRRALLAALPALALGLGGCNKDAAPTHGPAVSADVDALKRLVKLPAHVTHAEWQTGQMAEHGSDWWVAAVLDVPADKMAQVLADPATPGTLDTPPGMLATSCFAALKALPAAAPVADGRLHVTGDLHDSAPFASFALLQGHALQPSPTRVFVLVWTN
jgi:hypothetical protein